MPPVTRSGKENEKSFNSTLPWFRKKLEKETGLVRLTCMRSGCGGEMFVHPRRYPGNPTAPCMHCFAASRLPDPPLDLSVDLLP